MCIGYNASSKCTSVCIGYNASSKCTTKLLGWVGSIGFDEKREWESKGLRGKNEQWIQCTEKCSVR